MSNDDFQVVEAQSQDTRYFSAKHWSRFNQEIGWDFREETVYFAVYDKTDEVVGYAKVKTRGQVLELESLLVQRELRRQGVGSLLIREVEKYAKEHDCNKVIVRTSENHREAIRFYKKHGYKRCATLTNCYFGLNWYFFAKEI